LVTIEALKPNFTCLLSVNVQVCVCDFQTGAKIIIRGKGSVKEGKIGRKDGQPLPGEDEPLHAYVTANNPENVKKAVEKVRVLSLCALIPFWRITRYFNLMVKVVFETSLYVTYEYLCVCEWVCVCVCETISSSSIHCCR
jgi:hypothetical protein